MDKPLYEAEYLFQQYYSVTVDEKRIEDFIGPFCEGETREEVDEQIARAKRMARALVADQKALREVCLYIVLRKQDGGGGGEYVSTEFEDCGIVGFSDIVRKYVHCFTPGDQKWLMGMIARSDQIDSELERLAQAFHAKPGLYGVGSR